MAHRRNHLFVFGLEPVPCHDSIGIIYTTGFVSIAPQKQNQIVGIGGNVVAIFPNAPYILTDLFHLYPRTGIPQWYDLILILSFAWNGLMLGSASLFDMHELVKSRLGWLRGWLFTGFTLALGSFGIYLGRFERWNSWDILQQPFRLFSDIANFVLHPADYPSVWGMTICYTLLMWVLYATIYQLTKVQSRRLSAESVAQNRGKI